MRSWAASIAARRSASELCPLNFEICSSSCPSKWLISVFKAPGMMGVIVREDSNALGRVNNQFLPSYIWQKIGERANDSMISGHVYYIYGV